MTNKTDIQNEQELANNLVQIIESNQLPKIQMYDGKNIIYEQISENNYVLNFGDSLKLPGIVEYEDSNGSMRKVKKKEYVTFNGIKIVKDNSLNPITPIIKLNNKSAKKEITIYDNKIIEACNIHVLRKMFDESKNLVKTINSTNNGTLEESMLELDAQFDSWSNNTKKV